MANSMASSWSIQMSKGAYTVEFAAEKYETFCREIAFSRGVESLRMFVQNVRFNNGIRIGNIEGHVQNGSAIKRAFVEMQMFDTYKMYAQVELFNEPASNFDTVAAFVAKHFPTVQIEQHNGMAGGLFATKTYGFTLTGDEFVGPAFFWATALYRDGSVNGYGFEQTLHYPSYYPKLMIFTSLGPMYISEYSYIQSSAYMARDLKNATEYIQECGGFKYA